jgi:hypothetical protein
MQHHDQRIALSRPRDPNLVPVRQGQLVQAPGVGHGGDDPPAATSLQVR